MNCSIQIALNTKASCYEKLPLLLKIVVLLMNLNIFYDLIFLSFILVPLILPTSFSKKNKESKKTIYYLSHLFYSFD